MARYALFQLFQFPGTRFPGKNRAMDIFERVPASSPHDGALAIFLPLEKRSRTDAEFARTFLYRRSRKLWI